MRPLLEECDQLQGLQILTGIDDAWGGFASQYLDRLRDEMSKHCIWMWGIEGGKESSPNKRILQTVNSAKALYEFSNRASIYVPICNVPATSPYAVSLDKRSSWHTSALQAVGLETILTVTRLRSGARISLDHIEATLNRSGAQTVVKLEYGVAHLEEQASPRHGGASRTQRPDVNISLFPSDHIPQQNGEVQQKTFAKLESDRDVPDALADASSDSSGHEVPPGAPMLETYQTPLPFPILSSFPPIFQSANANSPSALAVHAEISTCTSIAWHIRAVERTARRLISTDEREVICNGLQELAEEYEEGWEIDVDPDDDDD